MLKNLFKSKYAHKAFPMQLLAYQRYFKSKYLNGGGEDRPCLCFNLLIGQTLN